MMKANKIKHFDDPIPHFNDLISFYKHINASLPLSADFDIREINPDVLKSYDYVAKPFRHSLYCIAFYLEGDVTLNTGFWKTRLDKPAIYFKTPFQILSWVKPARWLKEYFIVFNETFLLKNKLLAEIIFDLPFYKLEKAIPLELEPAEVGLLTDLYRKIFVEYRSSNKDRYDMIHAYTYTLLIHVRRLYYKYAESDAGLARTIKTNDNSIVNKFISLIKEHISANEIKEEVRSVKFYAILLSTHPNHLNAVVKRKTQKTALSLIHEQIIIEAKSLLSQTDLSIKVIASRLGFKESSHFNNFFKKQTNKTPATFKKEALL